MNATVTMPVSELDTLRETIKQLELEKKELESHQKEVRITVSKREMGFRQEYDGRYVRIVPKEHMVDMPPVYVNLDEVKEDLKEKVQTEFIGKIGSLERENIELQKKKEELKTNHQKDLKRTGDIQAELVKKHEETVLKLQNEIKVLKGELVDLSKDEQIKQLQEEISKLKNKTFIQRLFNI